MRLCGETTYQPAKTTCFAPNVLQTASKSSALRFQEYAFFPVASLIGLAREAHT